MKEKMREIERTTMRENEREWEWERMMETMRKKTKEKSIRVR